MSIPVHWKHGDCVHGLWINDTCVRIGAVGLTPYFPHAPTRYNAFLDAQIHNVSREFATLRAAKHWVERTVCQQGYTITSNTH